MEQQREPFPPAGPARFACEQMALFDRVTTTVLVTSRERAIGRKSFVIDSLLFFYPTTREQVEAIYDKLDL